MAETTGDLAASTGRKNDVASARPTIELDHHSPAFAEEAPRILAELRQRCPVAWSASYGGFWALTRYADVQRVLTDPATFSSRHDLEPGSPYAGVTIPSPPMRFIPVETDPPEALVYRRLLNPTFSPGAVERLRERITAFTDWCLDQVIETGEIDFVYDLASPVPAMVTLDIVGLPVEEWERYATTFHDMVAFAPGTEGFDQAMASAERINEDLRRVVAERRAQPGRPRRGLLDVLLDATVDSEPLGAEQVVDITRLVLAGGIDTTTGAAAGGLVFLAGHPEHRQQLIRHPELLGTAAEEIVRWTTPTPLLGRTATCPVEVGDELIERHERVMANLFAANRDPAAFPDPDEIVLDRQPNRHVSFGAGIHRCVGANLARAELEIMLERVLSRLPDYRLLDGVERYHTAGVQNGYIRVPAAFTPGPKVGSDAGFD